MKQGDEARAFDVWDARAGAVARLLKSAIGHVQFPGSLFGEVASLFRPSQNVLQMEKYVHLLLQRFNAIDTDELSRRLRLPDHLELFEAGALQAVRAKSDKRQRLVAEIVANGIVGSPNDLVESRHFLRVLIELTDEQIVFLSSHLERTLDDQDQFRSHGSSIDAVRNAIKGLGEKLDRNFSPELLQLSGLLESYRQIK